MLKEEKVEKKPKKVKKNVKKQEKPNLRIKTFSPIANIAKEIMLVAQRNGDVVLDKTTNNQYFLIAIPRELEITTRNYNPTFQPYIKQDIKKVCLLVIVKVGSGGDERKSRFQELIDAKCPVYFVNSVEGVNGLFQSFHA